MSDSLSANQPTAVKRNRFFFGELIFKKSLLVAALAMVVILLMIFFTLFISSIPAIKKFGLSFIWSTNWDPVKKEFGALPFLAGTLITSLLAILISIPFAFSIALFLGEYFRKGPFSSFLQSMIELMAGIPSVIYGFWGLFFLVPHMSTFQMWLNGLLEPINERFGWELFIQPYGVGIFTASVILAVMIIPYSASVAREVITMVPTPLKEASYSLGSTRMEMITKVIFPYARSGIVAGVLLSLGRALGETMAVTMVIGNRNILPVSIFDLGNTMASVIASEFNEAEGVGLAALMEIGLLLFIVSMVINISGKVIIKKFSHSS